MRNFLIEFLNYLIKISNVIFLCRLDNITGIFQFFILL